jgi:uncharacterized repeat protein (TIGR04138 family)
MAENRHPIYDMLEQDQRYQIEGYQFIREALQYSQDVLELGGNQPKSEATKSPESDSNSPESRSSDSKTGDSKTGGSSQKESENPENHLTGQQLCEGIRLYARDQYGYLAKLVLNSWGIHTTSDFGEMVYNLIRIEQMKKSPSDRREDFDDVYEFENAFEPHFITSSNSEV